jgi:site-specific recombinase XerD
MSKNDSRAMFFRYVSDFLYVRLREHEMRSENTIESYRYGLNSFRLFMEAQGIRADKVGFAMVTTDLMRDYMKWLVSDQGLSMNTRNHRLACLKSYLRYCAERDVSVVQTLVASSSVKSVLVRADKNNWMTRDAIQAILEQPTKTRMGIRDRFFMLFLYGTGARVSEALNVRIGDIELHTKDPFVRIMGKGNKPRCVPLLDVTKDNLYAYMGIHHPDAAKDDFLFYTVIKGQKGRMSVANAERIVKKHGESARAVCAQVPECVHPHMFRHSYGAHLYRMGFPLPVIAKLLDHESLSTTEIYAETDTEMVNEAFKTLAANELEERRWKSMCPDEMAKLFGLK